MKYTKLALFLFAVFSASAQKKTEEIFSSKLNDKRKITVVLPPYYQDDKTYPLVVLLDGEYLTDPFAGTFAYTSYWDDLPEVIIVGIHQNKDNKRVDDSEFDQATGFPYGGGADFYEFIAQELIPYMEESYGKAPFRVIAGHNITAGFINAFLFKDKPVFNAYIALSPELPEGMETMLPERLAALKKPVYYYLATGGGDVESIQKKIKTLNENIAAVTNPSLHYHFDEFKDASHYALAAYAIPAAIYRIFSLYQPISSDEYQKIVTMPSGYSKYLEDRYSSMERELGFKTAVRLNDFKAIETAILKNAVYDELRDLSDLAKKNYPKTLLGEYYTALFYEMTGDTKRAIKTYVNSYSLKPIGMYTKDFMMARAETIKSGQ